jgi:hypothetical protein
LNPLSENTLAICGVVFSFGPHLKASLTNSASFSVDLDFSMDLSRVIKITHLFVSKWHPGDYISLTVLGRHFGFHVA